MGHCISNYETAGCLLSGCLRANMRIDISANQQTGALHSAFTRVEVMVGVLAMAIMLAGLYLGFSQGFAVIQATRENLRATQILQEKMETIRLFQWEDITTAQSPYGFTNYSYPLAAPGGQGTTFYGTRIIASAPVTESYSNDIRLVSVQLNWASGKVQRQCEMKTLVSRYGLHNYFCSGNP